MEAKKMIKSIVGIVIGLALLAAGVFYLVKEKNDAESRKIYGTVCVVGAVIAAASAAVLVASVLK